MTAARSAVCKYTRVLVLEVGVTFSCSCSSLHLYLAFSFAASPNWGPWRREGLVWAKGGSLGERRALARTRPLHRSHVRWAVGSRVACTQCAEHVRCACFTDRL